MTDVYVSCTIVCITLWKKNYFENNVLSVIPAKHRTPSGLYWFGEPHHKYNLCIIDNCIIIQQK